MKTNSRKPKRPAEAKTSRTAQRKGDYVQRLVSCPRCKSRGKDWNGSDPKCAFATGVFNPDNWNCATANALRDIVKADNWNNNDDQHACLITGVEESLHVLLHWYKSRGRTEGAWMVTIEGEMKPLTLAEAERVVAANAALCEVADKARPN